MTTQLSPIMDALYHGRRDEAERLARDAGASGLTIHEAAAMGDVSQLEALLDQDPSLVNAFALDGFQPLGLAAFFGRAEAARLLLARGGDVNMPSRNNQRVNALHAALAGPASDLARSIVEAGADVNMPQQDGVTPLHEAAINGRADLVRLLLDHGADPTARDGKGRSAADFARTGGHQAVLDVLG